MPKRLELSGRRFGKLTAIRIAEKREIPTCPRQTKNPQRWWLVRCDCGKERVVRGNSLTSGMSNSCAKFPCRRPSYAKPLGEAAKWGAYVSSMESVKQRNKNRKLGPLVWALSLEQFLQITASPCNYCGLAWSKTFPCRSQNRMNGEYKHNGIDRMDNKVGYIVTNCVACCLTCNVAKAQMTVEEFHAWIVRVYRRHTLRTIA